MRPVPSWLACSWAPPTAGRRNGLSPGPRPTTPLPKAERLATARDESEAQRRIVSSGPNTRPRDWVRTHSGELLLSPHRCVSHTREILSRRSPSATVRSGCVFTNTPVSRNTADPPGRPRERAAHSSSPSARTTASARPPTTRARRNCAVSSRKRSRPSAFVSASAMFQFVCTRVTSISPLLSISRA